MSIGHGIEAAGGIGGEQPNDEQQSAGEQIHVPTDAQAEAIPGAAPSIPEQGQRLQSVAAETLGPPAIVAAAQEQQDFGFKRLEPYPTKQTSGNVKKFFRDTRVKVSGAIGGIVIVASAIGGILHGNNSETTSPPAATAEQNPGGNALTTAISSPETTSSSGLILTHPNTAPTTVRGVIDKPGNLAPDLQISELAGTAVTWNGKQVTLLPMLVRDTYYGPNQEATYTLNNLGNGMLQQFAYLLSADQTTPEYQQVLERFSPNPTVQTSVKIANTNWGKEHPGADAVFFDTSDSPVNFAEQIQGYGPVVGTSTGTLYLRAIDRSLERTFGDSANDSKFDAAPVDVAFKYDTVARNDDHTGAVITALMIAPAEQTATNAGNTPWFSSIYFNAGNIPQ